MRPPPNRRGCAQKGGTPLGRPRSASLGGKQQRVVGGTTDDGSAQPHGRQHYRAHRCFPRMQERGGRRSRAGALLLIAPGGRLIGMDRDACLPARAAGARTGVRWTRGQGSWVGGRLGGSRVVRAPTAAGRVGGDEDLRGSARRRALSSRSGRRSCGALVPAVESIAHRPKPRRRVQRRARRLDRVGFTQRPATRARRRRAPRPARSARPSCGGRGGSVAPSCRLGVQWVHVIPCARMTWPSAA